MDFEGLKYFLLYRMKMSHIYQPIIIRTLLFDDRLITDEDIANEVIPYDHSQIEYYEKVIKRMPTPILIKNCVIRRNGNYYELELNLSHVSKDERDELIRICNQRLEDYLEHRGVKAWQRRLLRTSSVTESEKEEIIRLAGFRCQMCGVMDNERRLIFNQIIPSYLGGLNTMDNFQAICSTCKIKKDINDKTNFWNWVHKYEKQ